MKLLFRVDCNNEIGFGHIYRCLCLAQEIKKLSPGLNIAFCVRDNAHIRPILKAHGFPMLTIQENVETIVQDYQPDIFIGDIRDGLSPQFVRNLSQKGVLTVAIDEPSDYRRSVDLAFYPPLPQLEKWEWGGFAGKIFAGWKYVILRPEFFTNDIKEKFTPWQALVTFGGSDPEGLAIKTAHWMVEDKFPGEINVLLGSYHLEKGAALNKQFAGKVNFHYRPSDLAKLMASSSFAITAFGVMAYELAALKVPAIHVARSREHWESSLSFSNLNMAISLCEYADYKKNFLKNATEAFLNNQMLLAEMSKNCQVVKADGGRQIAEVILSSAPKPGLPTDKV